MRIGIKRSVAKAICKRWGLPCVLKSVKTRRERFLEIKAALLKHCKQKLREAQAEAAAVKKSLAMMERLEKAGFPVGTIRTWNGRKFRKIAPGKWRRVYQGNEEAESKGGVRAWKNICDKLAKIDDERELMWFVQQNRMRFIDNKGYPLNVVEQLSELADVRNLNIIAKKSPEKIKELEDEAIEREGFEKQVADMKAKVNSFLSEKHTLEELRGMQADAQALHDDIKAMNGSLNNRGSRLSALMRRAVIPLRQVEAAVLEAEEGGERQEAAAKEAAAKQSESADAGKTASGDNPPNGGGGDGGEPPSGGSNNDFLKTSREILDVLGGNSVIKHNASLDADISVEKGKTGKHGWGLNHIIEQRLMKDKRNTDEITALLFLIMKSVADGDVVRDVVVKDKEGKDIGSISLKKDGVIAFIGKSKNGTGEKFVITGYDDQSEGGKATESIKSVIDKYGYAPEFVIVKEQVGAVASQVNIPQSAENASKIKEQYEDALREYKKADENFFKTAAAVDYTLPPAVITDCLWVDVVDPDYKNFVKDSEKALEAAARQLREDEEAAQQLPRAEKRKKRDEFMQRAKDWHKRREDFAAKRKEREQKIIRDYLNTREYKAARWYLERMGIPFRESGFCHPWRSDALKPARSNLSRARYLLWNAQSAAKDAGINVDEYYYRTKASNLTESELMKKVVQDFENATRAQDSSSHDTQKSLPPRLMLRKSVVRRALRAPLPRLAFTKSGRLVVRK